MHEGCCSCLPILVVPQKQPVVDGDPCSLNLGEQAHVATAFEDCACARLHEGTVSGREAPARCAPHSRLYSSKSASGRLIVLLFTNGCHAALWGNT